VLSSNFPSRHNNSRADSSGISTRGINLTTQCRSKPCPTLLFLALSCVVLTQSGCTPRGDDGDAVALAAPSATPGTLNGDPIAPPYLTDVDRTSASSVAMRFGDESQLVQKRAEVVPTPVPDGAPKKGSTSKSGSTKPELVPTPDGAPVGATSDKMEFPEGVAGPEDYTTWETPVVTLVVTGQQNGYIEPCGCTGLDRQKGGVARRFTLIKQLKEKGWTLVPVDAGNQVRRFGRQAEVKLQQTVRALKQMDYQAVGFGPSDVRLGVGELLSVAVAESADDALFVSANVVLIDPEFMPKTKLIDKNGYKIGITSILDPGALEVQAGAEIVIDSPTDSATKAVEELSKTEANYKVLMFYGKEKDAQKLVQDVPGFDLLIVAGGYGEPTFQAEEIENSQTRMIVTGNKGMYAGLVGIFPNDDEKIKYARVPLTHEFSDAPEMRQLMKDYQEQLRDIGLEGLGLLPPIPHSSGQKFVGTEKCGECHTKALEVWQGTPHSDATEHIVKPPRERGDVARHFDPECLSCHATGWNPQEYYPYASGYLSLESTEHLTGNGCENCHGPGSGHSDAEAEGATVSQEERQRLRDSMKLTLEKARDKCMECHDLDNSPDFHETDAFEDVYWPQVEHSGKD
jgi:Cytochrome c554 and c-prime